MRRFRVKNVAKIAAIMALAVGATAKAESPSWTLSESTGSVHILRAGVSSIAVAGGSLRSGDVVSTGKKGRAVLVRGREYVVVSPNSRLRITNPESSSAITQFFEEIGTVLFKIERKSTPHFGVQTPYMAAVVKGTTFSVTVSDRGSAVQVTDGAVQVATNDGGASYLLSPGAIGMVEAGQQYRLVISGAESKVIDSPNAAHAPAPTEAARDSAGDGKAKESVRIAGGTADGVIDTAIANEPVSLGSLTGGLVNSRAAIPTWNWTSSFPPAPARPLHRRMPGGITAKAKVVSETAAMLMATHLP